MKQHVPLLSRMAIAACLGLAGCSSLLPRNNTVVEGPWASFEAAQQTFDQIIPYQTAVEDLKTLGLDPLSTPNVTLLSYSDVLQRFVPSPSINAEELDSGVRDCLKAKMACRGFEIDQRIVKRKRYGNFWVDWLGFERKVDVTGWHFKGMVLIKDRLVVYKLVSGQPMIHQLEKSDNPLGPLQGVGEAEARSRM